jgi:Domain of unknown function (DUF6883)
MVVTPMDCHAPRYHADPEDRHAIIDERKLTAYVLSLTHARGRDKARIFRSTLGYDRASCADLIEQLRRAILKYEAVFVRQDRYGRPSDDASIWDNR